MPAVHATAFLQKPDATELAPVIAIFGADGYLRGEVLRVILERINSAGEAEISRFDGDKTELKSVTDELRTVSMWGDARVAVVEGAEPFVTEYRAALEKFAAAPVKAATLILLVKTWPKNTRLAKAVAKTGLAVECGEMKGAALVKWVCDTATNLHGKQLPRPCAASLVELVGNEPGLLTQEVAKLASYVGERPGIGEEDIRAVAGGWATQTAFQMMEQLVLGNLPKALEFLDQILASGEAPQRLMGAIAFSIRQLAKGVEGARNGRRLTDALADAGMFRNRIDAANKYLRRIGRPRAEKFLANLVRTNAEIKGASRAPDRISIEHLLVRLSGRLPVEAS